MKKIIPIIIAIIIIVPVSLIALYVTTDVLDDTPIGDAFEDIDFIADMKGDDDDDDNEPPANDTDGDGMPDWWESQYLGYLDPYVDDAGEDPDGDDYTNIEEYEADPPTDPTDPNDYPGNEKPEGAPTAKFTASTKTPNKGESVTFNSSESYDEGDGVIVNYTWDWGDGNNDTTNDTEIEHQWTQAGSYVVTLTVIDDDNKTGSAIKRIGVTDSYQFSDELNTLTDTVDEQTEQFLVFENCTRINFSIDLDVPLFNPPVDDVTVDMHISNANATELWQQEKTVAYGGSETVSGQINSDAMGNSTGNYEWRIHLQDQNSRIQWQITLTIYYEHD